LAFVTGGVNPHIDGGIFEVEDRPTVGARLDYLTICGFEAAGRRGNTDVVRAAGGRTWLYCDEDIQDEGLIDVQMSKPIARNDGRAGIPRTYC
jgi:hypothetical protein